MIRAVMDIGSNSVRMMLSRGGKTLSKDVIITKLAQGSASSALLVDAAIDRTCLAISALYNIAKKSSDDIAIFATEALRRASNKAQLIERVREETGLDIDVISGDIEAKIGYIGATQGRSGRSTIIDVGGASSEVIVGKGKEIIYGKSMPIGAVKLTELAGGDYNYAREIAEHYIASLDLMTLSTGTPIAIGGTATTLASVAMEMREYDSARVHNSIISSDKINKIASRLALMTDEERRNVVGLQPQRAEVITAGIIIMQTILARLGKAQVIISESDNLEGYLLYKTGEQQVD